LHFTVWINILKDIKMFVCTLTTQFQSRARVYCTMTFILLQWKIYSFVFILYSGRGSSFSYFFVVVPPVESSRNGRSFPLPDISLRFASLSLFLFFYFTLFIFLPCAMRGCLPTVDLPLLTSTTTGGRVQEGSQRRRRIQRANYWFRFLPSSFPSVSYSFGSFLFLLLLLLPRLLFSNSFHVCLFFVCSLLSSTTPSLSSANDDNSDGVQQRAEFSNSLTLSRLTATMKYANDDWAGLDWIAACTSSLIHSRWCNDLRHINKYIYICWRKPAISDGTNN